MKDFDCLLIGHNEIPFPEYIKRQQVNQGVTDELSYAYLLHKATPTNLQDIYNLYASKEDIEKYGNFDSSNLFNSAVAYLGSYMHRKGISFDYINSFHSEKAKLVEKLTQNNYLTIAITTTFHFLSFPIQEIIILV